MGSATLYSVAVLLLIAAVVSDGQLAYRRKTTHGRSGPRTSVFKGKPLVTVNKANHGHRHSFSDGSRQVRERHASKRFRAAMIPSSLPLAGDPDSVNNKDRKVIRVTSGNVGYFRMETPQWFRPFYKFQSPDNAKDLGPSAFFGSLIVVSPFMGIIDSNRPDHSFVGGRFHEDYAKSWLVHSPDEVIEDRWIYKSSVTPNKVNPVKMELVSSMPSGLTYYHIRNDNGSNVDFGKHVIKWNVNYNRHGRERLPGRYPDDKYRRPELGCFGFMYTTMKFGAEDVLVNTEYPVSIIEYIEDEQSVAYANDGPYDYGQYATLEGVQNGISPVFCGIEGSLRYIARQMNSTTKKLIPLHDIANEIKLADYSHFGEQTSRYVYPKLAKMMNRRDRDKDEPGWMPQNMPPWWFRPVYRKNVTQVAERTSWFAGYAIFLTKEYFLIPDHVAEVSVHTFTGRNWTAYNSFDAPTSKIISFGSRPEGQENGENWPGPRYIQKIHQSQMSLFSWPLEKLGWRETGLPKIQMGKDYTESNCDYLTYKLIGKPGDQDTRYALKTPAHVIPNSCSQYFCYVIFDADKEPGVFDHMNPVMCEGYPAFVLMDTKARPAARGRLALKIEYIMHHFKLAKPGLYDELRDLSYQDQSGKPGDLYPNKPILVGKLRPPSWFRAMLNKSPNLGPLLDYAGSLVIVGPKRFVVANYVLNNALSPNQFSPFRFADSKLETNKRWIYEPRAKISRKQWSGRHVNDEGLEEKPHYYPKVDHYIDELDMVVMTRESGFGPVEPPTLRNYHPQEPISSQLHDCHVYTYTMDDTRQLMFTEVPASIERCDDAYCYGTVNPFDARYDINQGVHAGAPVVCGTDLMFFNAPYPDHLNRAQFRLVHQALVYSRLDDNLTLTNIEAPKWYRILLSRDIIPPYPQTDIMLPQAVVLSDSFFIAVEEDMDAALELSAQRNGTSWMMFQTIQEPTPGSFGKLNVEEQKIIGDVPLKRMSLSSTGLAIYHRKFAHEQAGFGSNLLSAHIKKDQEPRDDCWVYLYRRDLYSSDNEAYRLYRSKVSIKHCQDGSCETLPNHGLFREGAPVVCDGVLSYIYEKRRREVRPSAIPISWINQQVKLLDDELYRLQRFDDLSPEDKMRQREWYNNLRPYYPHNLGPLIQRPKRNN